MLRQIVCLLEFVPHIEKLFDESVLIGSGWTTYESLRYVTYAYSIYSYGELISAADSGSKFDYSYFTFYIVLP